MTRYQPVRLWIGQIFGGRWTGSPTTLYPSPGSQHSYWIHLGSDLSDQGRQVTEMSSTTSYIHLALCLVTAVLYLHCPITYSCTQCREMLHRLCSLQTNLHISSTINLMYHYTHLYIVYRPPKGSVIEFCNSLAMILESNISIDK